MMKFPRNQWYVAAASDEIKAGQVLARKICNEDVVIFRDESGSARILEDRCPHRMAPLSLGAVKDGKLECGYHGALFNGDGKCVHIPCQPATPQSGLAYYTCQAYATIERFSYVFMWLGKPEEADPSLLPNWGQYTGEGWKEVLGYHHVKGNYMLLIDNLNDLTHLTYVHKNTLGRIAGSSWTEFPVEVTISENAVYTSRVMRNLPPTLFVRAVRKLSDNQYMDRFQTSEFSAPAFIAVVLGAEPPEDNLDQMRSPNHVVLNAVTPETDTTSHYFWSVTRHQALDDEDVSNYLYEVTKIAFDEDCAMIEAQQARILTAPPERRLLNFAADRAVVATRRLVESKLAQESGRASRELPAAPGARPTAVVD